MDSLLKTISHQLHGSAFAPFITQVNPRNLFFYFDTKTKL